MEDIWKRFKEETSEDLNKIRSFLNEMSHSEKSFERKIVKHKASKPKASKKMTPRKKIYGKLSTLVKEIMEKENLSRAQAYRVARKRFDNF